MDTCLHVDLDKSLDFLSVNGLFCKMEVIIRPMPKVVRIRDGVCEKPGAEKRVTPGHSVWVGTHMILAWLQKSVSFTRRTLLGFLCFNELGNRKGK